MTIPQFFHPAPPSQEYLVRLVHAQYQIWREEKRAREEKWEPQNIRFEHDPLWRYRFMSIQSARDGNHPVWRVVKIIFASGAAASAPYILGY